MNKRYQQKKVKKEEEKEGGGWKRNSSGHRFRGNRLPNRWYVTARHSGY